LGIILLNVEDSDL